MHMSRPFKLFRLQQIDTQIDRLKARLREIESILQDEQRITLARERWQTSKAALSETQSKLKEIEHTAQQCRIKISQSEAALYGGRIHNPKELEDLHNEVIALKRYLENVEDKLLEAMLLEEEAAVKEKECLEELEEAIRQKEALRQELLTEKGDIENKIAQFEVERAAAVTTILPEDLNIYQKLRETKHGVAVSKISDQTCSTCGSVLNKALLHRAHSPNEINRCDSCGRILYVG